MGHSAGGWAPALTLSPSLAPSVIRSCFGPCFCWCCMNMKGGLASLTGKVHLMPWNVFYSAFHLTMISRGKESRDCIIIYFRHCSLCPSFKDNNRLTSNVDSLWNCQVLQVGSHSVTDRAHLSVSIVLYVLAVLDGLIWESKLFFSSQVLFKLKLPSGSVTILL